MTYCRSEKKGPNMYLDWLKVTCALPIRGVGITVARMTIRKFHYSGWRSTVNTVPNL